MGWRVVVGLVGLTAVASAARAESGKRPIAVMAISADDTVRPALAKSVDEVILSEFSLTGSFEPMGSSDILAILEAAEQRQMLGCTDDACLAELSGALGVELIAVSTLGTIADEFVLSIKILDTKKNVALARASEKTSENLTELLRAVRVAVIRVTRDAGYEAAQQMPSSIPWWSTWAAGGVAGATLLGGTLFYLQGKSDEDKAGEYFEGTEDFRYYSTGADKNYRTSYIFFGIAGVAAVSTGVLYWLRNSNLPDPPPSILAFQPTPSGGGLATFVTHW